MFNSVGIRGLLGSYTPSPEGQEDNMVKDDKNEEDLKQLRDMLMPVFKSDATQSHSERSLRRFLRAAEGNVDKACANVLHYNHWRRTQGVDSLSPTDPDIHEHLAKAFVHTLRVKDAQGRPIMYVIVRKHMVCDRDLDKMIKFIVYMLEMTLRRMDEQVNDTLCLVFDMDHFSMANMDYPFVKRLVWLLTKFYPERLGVCLIYNAPVVFQGCWPIIRHWLHEQTSNKVVFVNGREALAYYLDVDGLPPQDM